MGGVVCRAGGRGRGGRRGGRGVVGCDGAVGCPCGRAEGGREGEVARG